MKLMDRIRHRVRSFLRVEDLQENQFVISNLSDWETNCYINKVWSWADKQAIEQLYKQLHSGIQTQSFWSSAPAFGIIKRHTGLPALMARVITDLIMADMNDITVNDANKLTWEAIAEKLNLKDVISDAVKETLIIGDGAFRISVDTKVCEYPLVDFVSGENVEYTYVKGILKEVIFKSPVHYSHKTYTLEETYGYGYIRTKLYESDKEVPLSVVPHLEGIIPEVIFDANLIMAVPLKFFKSERFKHRGASIYDGKPDSFDSFDETWSIWMDALRKGRTKEYIPRDMLPVDPSTGQTMRPNDYDHAFIAVETSMSEGGTSKIDVEQPAIPHDSYLSTYITALDLCLQGIISPSTLGIDTKKLDNAEAQREKEKTTLYTRNKVIEGLQTTIPRLVSALIGTWTVMQGKSVDERMIDVDVPFGEYANPSFESQVETITKAKIGAIMSTEAAIDELYGDTRDEEWKKAEVERIKQESGVMETPEPALNDGIGE